MTAKLVIKIADSGTIYHDPVKGDHPSLTGHMWWELHDSNGQVTSYGFSPKDGYEGMPIAPGSVKYNDSSRYEFNTSQGDYKGEFEITKEQFDKLKEFGTNPFADKFNFSSTYIGTNNSCIDFTYKALDIIGFVPTGYDGDVWPTLNIDNIRAIPSSNPSDNQIFIGKDGGGLFLLDNKNQMTVKLFGEAADVDAAQINSVAIKAAKLGSAKVSIKDSTNQNIAKFEIKQGDQTFILNNSALLKEEAKFFDFNGKEVSQDNSIIKIEDTDLGKLTVIRTDVSTTLKDGTTATLSSIINTIDSSIKAFDNFIGSGFSSITKKLFGVESNSQGLAAEIALSLANGSNLEEIATKIALREILISPAFDRISQELNGVFTNPGELDALRASLLETKDDSEQLRLITDKLGSEDEALKMIDYNELQNNPSFNAVKGGIIQFTIIAAIDQIEGGDKMNKEEYTEAAAQIITQQAVTLGVSSYFGTEATPTTSASISPAGFGVGVAVGYLASAAVRDLFADDHMNSHQWQSTTMTAAAMGATAGAIGGAAIAMGLIQASALLGPIGFAIGIVAAVIVTQVFGGKEYGPGEYPDPYSYLKIEAKEDGTGNKIIGIEPEGVVAIAREYYHDDLYGNSGSDNLIGKSGTNTIYGYSGNDHLEGRGDVDLLVGGNGDDEAFGGNGNDQIYGGNGNDQIMGEAGNDTIQGNAGNDTILGGIGNDRIEGSENIVANDNFQQLLESKFKRELRL